MYSSTQSSHKAAISKCSQFLQQRQKDGLTVLALFNLCPKIKKVLNQIWQSSWWSKNPRFVLLDPFEQIIPFIYKQQVVFLWEEKTCDKRKHESLTRNQLVANTQFLIALVTRETQFWSPVMELFASLRLPKFDKTRSGNNQIATICLKARLLIATVLNKLSHAVFLCFMNNVGQCNPRSC